MARNPRAIFVSAVVVMSGALAQTLACSGAAGGSYVGEQPALDPDDPGSQNGKPDGEGGAFTRDGGIGADGARLADADVEEPPSTPTKVGRILVGQTVTISGAQRFYSSYASAMFFETSPASSSTSCTYNRVGACHVYDCPLGGTTADAGGVRYAGAGTVSITGGFTRYDLEIGPGEYTSVSSQQLLFEEGTVLRVSSTGGEVPAFSNQTLTVPTAVFDVASPPFGAPLSIARSQALPLSWSGADGRDVQVNVSTVQEKVRSVSIQCTFPGNARTASVPAAAMGKLLPTDAATKGFVSVGSPIETAFTAGSWAVSFALNTVPASGSFTTSN